MLPTDAPVLPELVKLRKSLMLTAELCDSILVDGKSNANQAAIALPRCLSVLQQRVHLLMLLLGIEETGDVTRIP
jgi:hypothetical protein